MMKKILAFLVALIVIPVSTFAISLSELQNNPDQYKSMGETSVMTGYLDMSSIESLRYSPPYYTIKCDAFFVDYNMNIITESSMIFNYDYNYSMHSTIKRIASDIRSNNEVIDKSLAQNRINAQMAENDGITVSTTHETLWKLNGEFFTETDLTPESIPAKYNTVLFYIAEEVFHKYYNQWF